jgi:glycogen debranching enzyme
MSGLVEIEGQFYIPASDSSVADAANRVLKHADMFAILDRHGDIRPLGFENQGLFYQGTRFVSLLKLEMNGKSPLLLSSSVKEENDLLLVDLTNPELGEMDRDHIRSGIIHFARKLFLWESDCFEHLEVSNFGLEPVSFALSYRFRADFVDLFELRGIKRERRGNMLVPIIDRDKVTLQYEGLDGVRRQTTFQFSRTTSESSSERAVFSMTLRPQEQTTFDLRISCRVGEEPPRLQSYDNSLRNVLSARDQFQSDTTRVETSNSQFNDWLHQSHADLHMLVTQTECGPYPFAGIPWYSCVFGRDAIITALEMLWCCPQLARGVLSYLASTQAAKSVAAQDAEPGKIVHEQRKGEMAALGEIPFGNYYGTIDATPLFVVLAGRYYERTADKELIVQLWPNIERALHWIDRYGDFDGDGYVEYSRRAERGLSNQGWKDSEDSIFHADGTLAGAPIALCEVQGYVFEAKLLAARLAAVLGQVEASKELNRAARRLQKRFERDFWCDDLQCYALALDGDKRPCKVRSSNAGHCLFSGIASRPRAARVARIVTGDTFFSGWGIRTIAATEARYNPMSYHNGSIWPHDNALIAAGLARYGFQDAALQVLTALFDASMRVDLNRLPELFCGFPRRDGEGPTLYPVACNPQAWASAAVFFLLQSCLGLRIDAERNRVYFHTPSLPEFLREVDIVGLKTPTDSLDLTLRRHAGEVAVNLKSRTGSAQVVVIH